MARTPPPSITPTPTPAPQRGDRTTFSSRVDAFIVWLTTAVGQFAAVALNVYNNAVDAFSSATSAATSADNAAVSAAGASRDAQTATMAPGTSATSTTSMLIGFGSKTFTLAQTGKLFKKGNTVTIATGSAGNNWMAGPITAFDPSSGVMTVNVTNFSGSGTFADWVISLSGAAGLTGVVNEQLSNSYVAVPTVNLNTPAGNLIHIIGNTNISAFTLPLGAERSLIFDGSPTLINSPSLLLPTGANIVVAPGDRALVRGDSNGSIITHYQRANGLALRSGAVDLVASAVVTTPVANIDFLNLFTPDYDKYVVEMWGIRPSASSQLVLNLANNGAVTSDSFRASATAHSNSRVEGGAYSFDIGNINSTSIKFAIINAFYRNSADAPVSVSATSGLLTSYPLSGFRLNWSGGESFIQGTIRIYGFKNIQ